MKQQNLLVQYRMLLCYARYVWNCNLNSLTTCKAAGKTLSREWSRIDIGQKE